MTDKLIRKKREVREYSLEEKEMVCAHFILTGGNSKSAARKFDIPAPTIRAWTKQKWWAETCDRLLKAHKKKMDGKHTYIIEAMTKELLDRVEKGDEIVNTKGEKFRRKMSGKDLMYALANLTLQRDTDRLAGAMEQKEDVESKLQTMQRKFEEAEQKRKGIEEGKIKEIDGKLQEKKEAIG